MKQKNQFYLGYVLTIVVGVLLTPIYALLITALRTPLFLFELLKDIFLFMPKAVYEYEAQHYKKIVEQNQSDDFKNN